MQQASTRIWTHYQMADRGWRWTVHDEGLRWPETDGNLRQEKDAKKMRKLQPREHLRRCVHSMRLVISVVLDGLDHSPILSLMPIKRRGFYVNNSSAQWSVYPNLSASGFSKRRNSRIPFQGHESNFWPQDINIKDILYITTKRLTSQFDSNENTNI